jgi:hypothetical protein
MAWTGSDEMSRFQMLSAGKIGQFENEPPPNVGADTVNAELAVCPSQVAVMLAEPAATPVTSPLWLTVAIAVLSLDQLNTRPVSVLPPASFAVALSWRVAPAARLTLAGETVTEATGTLLTVMVELPLSPSLEAEMCAVPAATAVTTP